MVSYYALLLNDMFEKQKKYITPTDYVLFSPIIQIKLD